MTDDTQPDWMKGYAPTPSPASGRWEKGMPSPNPRGRPKGIIDKRSRITKALDDDATAIVRVVIDAALEGDMQACGMVLARIAPTLKPQAERVAFDLDPTAPVAQQIESVLAAVASGTLAPDVGQVIIASLGRLADARAVAELEGRIAKLEGANS
jgi:hypothetical protein